MDWDVFKWIMAVFVVGPFAWAWKAIKDNKSDLADHKTHVAENYVSRETLRDMLKPINDNVTYIRDRFDEHIANNEDK